VTTRSANEWRDFWRERGELELARQLDEFEPHMNRIATLLGSRAPREALTAELGRIRAHELHAPPEPQRDDEIAARIHDWFTNA